MSKEQTTKKVSYKKWLDELTMELRLKDFSGQSIGDALATVEEFLSDSGQSPEEAFGTPREYANELAGGTQQPRIKGLSRTIVLGTTNLLIFLVFNAALLPWLSGERMLISGWQLVSMAVLAVLVLSLPAYLAYLLRHTWALVAMPVVGVSAGIFSAMLAPKAAVDAFLTFSPQNVLVITAALLIVLSVVATVMTLRTESEAITSPFDTAPRKSFKARALDILTQWLFPVLAAALLGMTALTQSLA